MVINFFALIYTKISFTTFLCHELNERVGMIYFAARERSIVFFAR